MIEDRQDILFCYYQHYQNCCQGSEADLFALTCALFKIHLLEIKR